MKVRLYVEGGAVSRKDDLIKSRRALTAWLKKLDLVNLPQVALTGPGPKALAEAEARTKQAKGQETVLALVDSEGTLENIEQPLSLFQAKHKTKFIYLTDEQILVMVQCMEAWICADKNAVREAYPKGQHSNRFEQENPESKTPPQLCKYLEKVSKKPDQDKPLYKKGKPAFELFGKTDPNIVAHRCPSAERAIRILKNVCNAADLS